MKQLMVMIGIAVILPISQRNVPPTTPIPAKHVDAFHIEQFGVYHALAEISQKAGIGIGVDAVQPDHEPTIVFDFPGGTVSDLLNLFLSQGPEYEWHESQSSMIHVSRRGSHVSLLDVQLSLQSSQKATRQEISEGLNSIPEITNWLNSNRCSRDQFTQGGEFRTHNDPISLPARTLTLEELLDEIALRSGSNYWAVLQNHTDGACHVTILM
jgi:hypothetical protein